MKPKALKWKTIHWNSGDVERAERGSMKRMKKAELLEKWSEYLHPDVRDWLISEIDSDLDELLREREDEAYNQGRADEYNDLDLP